MLPQIKAPYSRSIPKFELRGPSKEEIEQLQDLPFCIYSATITDLPVVLVVKPDRLHVYNDIAELKYDAFNQDLYSKTIGPTEIALRAIVPGLVLYGHISVPEGKVAVHNVWNYNSQQWLGFNPFESLRLPPPLILPSGSQTATLRHLLEAFGKVADKNTRFIIKCVNNTGIFFVL